MFDSNLFDLLNPTASVVCHFKRYLEAGLHACCKDKCGENEGEARAKLNYPAKTITVMISIYTARSNEKRLEAKRGRFLLSFLWTAKEAFWPQLEPLCGNILKSIMERSIDLLATTNWLCSGHRAEILISILHLAAISQHSKDKAILRTNWCRSLIVLQNSTAKRSMVN